LPDVAREDAAAATRLKAELQALVGPEGPSPQLIEDWTKRFPPPTTNTELVTLYWHGFTRPSLFRMRQFYEAYADNKKVSELLRQLPWTHHLIILSQARPVEVREFYILTAIRERWSSRELERQIASGAALRNLAAPKKKVSPAVTQLHPDAAHAFKDAYSLEFLDLPDEHSEADLHGALLQNLGRFITELGRDFCFVGSQYPVQVGNRDFAIGKLAF